MKTLFLLAGFALLTFGSAPAHAVEDATEAELRYEMLYKRLLGRIKAQCGPIATNQYGALDVDAPTGYKGCRPGDHAPPPILLAKLKKGTTATAVFCPGEAKVSCSH